MAAQGHDADALILGIPGFTYGDLYDPGRLQDLLATFDASLGKDDPPLFAEYEAYRSSKGEGLPSKQIS
ncbi:MAG: hypothetical protein V3S77_01485, partial [Acidiferrobacterales bacterium]